MGSFPSLTPLKVTKRSEKYQTLPYHESSRSKEIYRSEKHGQSDREYYSSEESEEDYDSISPPSSPHTNSSRETSGSYNPREPMMRRRINHRRFRPGPRYRIPQKVTRYLCFAIASSIVIFISSLIRMTHISRRDLERNAHQRPEPPKQWESFPFLTKYYGGIKTLVPLSVVSPEYPRAEDEAPYSNETSKEDVSPRDMPKSKAYNAYPDYESSDYLSDHAPVKQCYLDAKSTIKIPALQHYEGRPGGFPENIIGSYDLLNLQSDICFDRYGRYGPYGHGYSLRKGGLGSGKTGDMEGSEAVWSKDPEVDYSEVDWAVAQRSCYELNAGRFEKKTLHSREETPEHIDVSNSTAPATETTEKKPLPRTAMVVRTWDEYVYGEEDILYLRALIAELSLGSGGEYDVHLLVQVKDEKIPVFADEETYQKHLEERVPEEFRGITTLWSESQMNMLYHGLEETWARGEGLPVHGSYRGLTLAFQYFAHNHPEYDFFWQWEMDIRYTGHFYDLFSKFDAWSTAQPRKGLWERNARFYVPSVHGTWEDFKQMVRVQSESGTDSPNNIWSGIPGVTAPAEVPTADKAIWGPERPANKDDWFEIENDPKPPTPAVKDKYTWGVGEPADLVTLNPLFDPEGTAWGLEKDITGYNRTGGLPPRRAAIITASRLSKRLLNTMHRETAFKKHHAFPEMWAAIAALHHGYKAVYVPHPTFIDRAWPLGYLAATLNGGRNGASGGARTSVFGESREHNLKGVSWYYNSGFSGNLWRRWLGLKVDNEGGEVFETQGIDREEGIRGGMGRMCLPAMLVHPVKGVELPVEEVLEEHSGAEMDPDA